MHKILLLFALAPFLIPIIPTVRAQTTNITNISYPKRATFDLESRTTDPPLLFEATVSYSDAKPGYFLAVGVFDLDSGDLVGGSGSASNGVCDSKYARCLIDVKSVSGAEGVQFLLAGYKPTMSMAIVAVLYDETKNLIYNSESDYEFTITMTATLALSVRVPSWVAATVDGIQQPNGNVQLNLVPGTHTVSVPAIVQIENATRVKFERWSDGENQTSRTVSLIHRTTLIANYVTQYFLEASSTHGNSTGTGWYDQGSTATFSVPSAIPMENVLGLLGGKWVFQGWYENGELVTGSNPGTRVMARPHSLTARWAADLTLPLIIFGIVALVSLAIILTKKRKNSMRAPRKSRRGGRGRARA